MGRREHSPELQVRTNRYTIDIEIALVLFCFCAPDLNIMPAFLEPDTQVSEDLLRSTDYVFREYRCDRNRSNSQVTSYSECSLVLIGKGCRPTVMIDGESISGQLRELPALHSFNRIRINVARKLEIGVARN